jgi:protein-L-isoaspartate(D-aspartate) O-methyltransferase
LQKDHFFSSREHLINDLKRQGIIISDPVYRAMLKVPRHLFIPESNWDKAYIDSPLSIGSGQTISAPHMNAMMCEYLEIEPGQKILEIGTGSGYHAALLAELVTNKGEVYTIERHSDLINNAKKTIDILGYKNIQIKNGDGTLGWEEVGPFDRILVTAAGPEIPKPLVSQLSSNDGILCIPIGKSQQDQELLIIRKKGEKLTKQTVCRVVFVPLIGKYGFIDESER